LGDLIGGSFSGLSGVEDPIDFSFLIIFFGLSLEERRVVDLAP